MADGGPSQSPNFRPGNLSSQWVRPLYPSPTLGYMWIAFRIVIQRKEAATLLPKNNVSPLCLVFLLVLVERMLTILRNASGDILFSEMEDLILLKTHSFSQECPWTNTAETLTPVGAFWYAFEEGEFIINTNDNFSTGKSGAALLLDFSQLKLSGLESGEKLWA